MAKEKLFSVSIHDCRVDVYRGSGKGGQKRNKTSSAVRITHEPSGAVGQSEEQRSQLQNKKVAFKRMAQTKKFLAWVKIEASKLTGEHERIKQQVEREMKKVRVEVKDEKGRWIPQNIEEANEHNNI